jgi:hypothetical protein
LQSFALDKPEHSLLRQWLNYMLFSLGEEDPLGIDEPNPEPLARWHKRRERNPPGRRAKVEARLFAVGCRDSRVPSRVSGSGGDTGATAPITHTRDLEGAAA